MNTYSFQTLWGTSECLADISEVSLDKTASLRFLKKKLMDML